MQKQSEIDKYSAKWDGYESEAWKKGKKLIRKYAIKVTKWVFFGADFSTPRRTMETILHIADILAIIYIAIRLVK